MINNTLYMIDSVLPMAGKRTVETRNLRIQHNQILWDCLKLNNHKNSFLSKESADDWIKQNINNADHYSVYEFCYL